MKISQEIFMGGCKIIMLREISGSGHKTKTSLVEKAGKLYHRR